MPKPHEEKNCTPQPGRKMTPRKALQRCHCPRMPGLLLAAAAICSAFSASCLDIEQSVWGFAGRMCPRTFSMLSVLVSNPTPEPYEGSVTLLRTDLRGEQRGARLIEPCVLAPYGSRWLQFYPRTPDLPHDTWRLQWEGGIGASLELPTPPRGSPEWVYLAPAARVTSARLSFPSFAAPLFPTVLGATEGLAGVILDHQPRWEEARRSVFLDWLRGGGVVHLCQGIDGTLVTFTGALACLNGPLGETPFGRGRIVRHDLPAPRLRPEQLANPEPHPTQRITDSDSTALQAFDAPILQRVSGCVVARHNWTLIFWLSAIYLVLVFPGNYLLGRRTRHYRVPLGFFAVVVLLFAAVLQRVGRRGYGEETLALSLAHARPLEAGRYSVSQWSNVFVTRSDSYVLSHASAQNIYATAQQMEAVNGVIRNGREGRFSVIIPLYSKRSFVHHGVFSGPALSVEPIAWFDPESGTRLRLDGLSEITAAWLYHQDTFYQLQHSGDNLLQTNAKDKGQPRGAFLAQETLQTALAPQFRQRQQGNQPVPSSKELLQKTASDLLKPLIAHALGGRDLVLRPDKIHLPGKGNANAETEEYPLAPDSPNQPILFILTPSPDSFALQSPHFLDRETGYVLYEIPVPSPADPGVNPHE